MDLASRSGSATNDRSAMPRFEHAWHSVQWHKGCAGMGRGWDEKPDIRT